jgi:hypothetical protein
VEKKNKRTKKDLKMKLAFVFDRDSLIKLKEVELALLRKEDRKINQSEIIRMAVDELWGRLCKK